MPSELLNRLQLSLRTDKQQLVMHEDGRPRSGPAPHWPGGGRANFGTRLQAMHSIMIHGTSGWPSHQSATGMTKQYLCQVAVKQGEGPTFVVDCNGTVQQLIDMDPPRITLHGGYMNGISLGIENTDIGDETIQPQANSTYWRRPSGLADDHEDLAGLKLYVALHPQREIEGADVIPLWFPTSQYSGPGDVDHASRFHTLFTDADYRSLARVSRFMAESLGVPRNFPLLPYADRSSNADHVETLRRLVLADERRDMMLQMFGRTLEEFTSNAATLDPWYRGFRSQVARNGGPATINSAWTNFFADGATAAAESKRCYRGFLTHVMPGSITADDDHNCPGPYFDWHRFAREVWDWWWYPFDFDNLSNPQLPAPTLIRRNYEQARRDTLLVDYYFDATAHDTNYESARAPGTAANSADGEQFNTGLITPIYAPSNGVAVAARILNDTETAGQPGFLLTRHEVFHRTQSMEHGGVSITLSGVDYDRPPSFVYSLITHLKSPLVNFDDLAVGNPEWLNRFIKRLYECKKTRDFQQANAGDVTLRNAWRHDPLPDHVAQRLSVGAQMQRDADDYQLLLDEMKLGHAVSFPTELSLNATTVRVILGDFLGIPGMSGSFGVGISLFSLQELPVPNRVHGTSTWSTQDWWQAAANATALEDDPAKRLPANGLVWRYPMLEFLKWANNITWTSEWAKQGVQGDRPAKPRPRRGL